MSPPHNLLTIDRHHDSLAHAWPDAIGRYAMILSGVVALNAEDIQNGPIVGSSCWVRGKGLTINNVIIFIERVVKGNVTIRTNFSKFSY